MMRSMRKVSFFGKDRAKAMAFGAALLQCFSIAFFYAYATFSSRLKDITGITSSEVVLLGVLSQTGLGVLQLPMTLSLAAAARRGVSVERLDRIISSLSGLFFCLAVTMIGATLYLCEQGRAPSYGTLVGTLCAGFFIWGLAAGMTFNAASTIINFNNSGNNARRRAQLVVLSCSVGLGGVVIVILYHYLLAKYAALSSFFFGLCVFYFCITLVRLKWMIRIRHKVVTNTAAIPDLSADPKAPKKTGAGPATDPNASHEDTSNDEEDVDDATVPEEDDIEKNAPPVPPPTATERVAPQPLSALFRSDIVWLTCLGTFLGVGIGGTFLSSIGNLGTQLQPDSELTFMLTLIFLVLQTTGRLMNAIAYGYGDWPYIFAFWQAFCLIGVAIFLISPTTTGAYLSSALVGLSFGGMYSSFPILAATQFPGSLVDYPQSVGITFGISSIGCIVVGQLTTVVYNAASIQDLVETGFFGTFLFFAGLLVVSTLSAILLGVRIRRRTKAASKKTAAQSAPAIVQADAPQISAPRAVAVLQSPGAALAQSPRARMPPSDGVPLVRMMNGSDNERQVATV